MPQINRIRIINFSYNNDKRHIIDERFNFYKGENALLSLKNGGGKSVLVQLIIQPIIPLLKLQGRSFKEFFKKRKTPTFVLIEWKLEGGGGYLLTGICISNRETITRESQESENTIKYFTFTSNYTQGNICDINNIPLLNKENNTINILSFKEASDFIIEKSKNKTYAVDYFNQDDKIKYNQHLVSYNISPEEWRNVIARINSDEGGVIEIFEKCKTSQQLMREWMLKTVETVLFNDQKEKNKLEDMLENLIDEMIENEQYINEKNILEDFNSELCAAIEKISELISSFEKQKEIENKLVSIYNYLVIQSDSLIQKLQTIRESINEQINTQKSIDIEERSNDYYNLLQKQEDLESDHSRLKELLDKENVVSDELKLNINVQKSAKLIGEIKGITADIAYIDEQINKIKGMVIEKDEINNLEYSLKLKFNTLLDDINDKIIKIDKDLGSTENTIKICSEEIQSKENEITDTNHKKSVLGENIKNFRAQEIKIKKELELSFERNLFGEADKNALERAKDAISQKQSQLQKNKSDHQTDIDLKTKRQNDIQNELKNLSINEKDNAVIINSKEKEKQIFYDKERELKLIFAKYGFDFNKIYYKDTMNREFEKITDLYYQNHNDHTKELLAVEKTIFSLTRGTLHVSSEFSDFLNDNEIMYETGENYLRKQKKSTRNELLSNNPLLPFSFILTSEDIEKFKTKCEDSIFYNLIPIMSYSNLTKVFNSDKSMVSIDDNVKFLCLYNKDMINADDVNEYKSQLQIQKEELSQRIKEYKELYEQSRKDMEIYAKFEYSEKYINELENSILRLVKENEEIDRTQLDLGSLTKMLEEEKNSLQKSLQKLAGEIVEIESVKIRFASFVDANIRYENDVRELDKLNSTYETTIVKLSELKDAKERERNRKSDLTNNKFMLGTEMEEYKTQSQKYADAVDGNFIDEDIKVLESRLLSLKSKIYGDLERLENDKASRQKDLVNRNSELENIEISPDKYEGITFSLITLKNLEKLYKEKQEDIKKVQKQENICLQNLAAAKARIDYALTELLKISDEVLPKMKILLNFAKRRDDCVANINRLKSEEKETLQTKAEYERAAEKILANIDLSKRSAVIGEYNIEKDIKADTELTVFELSNIKKSNTEQEKIFSNLYNRTVNKFKDKNTSLDNIFKGLDTLKLQALDNSDNYYYFYERAINQRDALSDMIRVYENQLANLERNKNDMVEQSYMHSMQLYDEVKKITKDSAISLAGKQSPVSMLKIDMEDAKDIEASKKRMRDYIECRIFDTKEEIKKDKSKDEIKKNISKYMSAWELLNVISDLDKLVIRAYKIDINANNSMYKTWEQVMKENSGGERFVSFFAVLAALMSYSRSSQKNSDEYTRNKDTKVLLMDNPFGPISSEHLLKPLFDIAKKYHTQIICLTDLKQNSILNCFDLIYMLKIRTNTFGTNEYLKVEEEKRENSELESDEKLEKAIFRVDDYTQVELF